MADINHLESEINNIKRQIRAYEEDTDRCRHILMDATLSDTSRRCFVDLITVNEQAITRLTYELKVKERELKHLQRVAHFHSYISSWTNSIRNLFAGRREIPITQVRN